MIDGVPSNASVTLPVAVVEEWLGEGAIDVEPDLTVQRVAELFDRQPQTVRSWIREGRLGAYKLNGNEYRVTRRALEEFQEERRAEDGLRNRAF